MNKKRLLKLADFLETVPAKAFNIRNWQRDPATKPEGKTPGECGFAGCAVGWAVHAKLFRGLKFGEYEYGSNVPHYQGEYEWEAVSTLFDINNGCNGTGQFQDAEFLFCGLSYDIDPTPKQVAKRIRAFVASNGAVP